MRPSYTTHPDKLANYFLDQLHKKGAGKAKFFLAKGFRREEPIRLEQSLLRHPRTAQLVVESTDGESCKRVYECSLECPDGTRPCVRSIWVQLPGISIMRLITAYPTDPPG